MMTIRSQDIRRSFTRLKARVVSDDLAVKYGLEQPLKAELFSTRQLEEHAKRLAKGHEVDLKRGKDKLLPRLDENEDILIQVYGLLMGTIEKKIRIASAGEWLIDNFYLIEEQIRTARQHLPRHYSRELPHLKSQPLAGFPRVYHIAFELISHSDGRVHLENLNSFINAYQAGNVLNLGELWAVPIMLRLALLENLRRVALRIYAGRKDRDRANYWADRMITKVEKDPKGLVLEMASLAGSGAALTSAFVAELVRRLQGQSPNMSLPLTWMEQWLTEEGATIEQRVQAEGQAQASDQVSMGNSINSLRLLGAIDWKHFVESTSSINAILKEDPAGVYAGMDFETRDEYRHIVEKTARKSRLPENKVAHKAVELAAQNSAREGGGDRKSHVGYFLCDKGLEILEKATGKRHSFPERLEKLVKKRPLFFYLSLIFCLTSAFTFASYRFVLNHAAGGWALPSAAVLLAVCLAHLSISLVNWLVTLFIRPGALPRMDFSGGIPEKARTLVVVPAIIHDKDDMDDLAEGMEVGYLSNRGPNVYFGLLTDFPDSPSEEMPGDAGLAEYAIDRIRELNGKYAGENGGVFYLFHRPRLWNPQEGVWMGWERKRGKLEELNAFLLGGEFKDKRTIIEGPDIGELRKVKYVVTLDSDTRMPLDSVHKLAGTMAHPLNRPKTGPDPRRVTEGYAILQPRLAVDMAEAGKSLFVRIFGGEPGIDPYTKAVSDVYQGLFREGSFTGKGIYDVEMFSKTLQGTFPENLILSHDLIEGCHARASIVSDVQFFERHPSGYLADVDRRHRWVRGDWQILSWLRRSVPSLRPGRTSNPLSLLSQWKILDNLRRSVTPAAMLLLLLMGWTVLSVPLFTTLLVTTIILIPVLLSITLDLCKKPGELSLKLHFRNIVDSIIIRISQAVFTLASVPFEAFYGVHAVLLSLARMFLTHRKMLEWNPSGDAARRRQDGLPQYIKSIWFAPAVSLAMFIYFIFFPIVILHKVWFFLGLWFLFPAIAWRISAPIRPPQHGLSGKQTRFLRALTRKTWHFFETFVTSENHWLPPDNYQEKPVERVACRTSPTNIGLYLLSSLTALDFGYITAGRLVERIKNTFETLGRLERYKNHFYNWYDTRTLKPLPPLYVSTVDSGNLTGHLLVLEEGLNELPARGIISTEVFKGLEDAGGSPGASPVSLRDIHACLVRASDAADKAETVIPASGNGDTSHSSGLLRAQCKDHLEDLLLLAPWLSIQGLPSPGPWERLFEKVLSLDETARLSGDIRPRIREALAETRPAEEKRALEALEAAVTAASEAAAARMTAVRYLAVQCAEFADADYAFLYDDAHRLLRIGYNVGAGKGDNSYYDLLASESRLVSYVSVAKKQLPVDHWFALGRLLTVTGGEPVLLSWGGSMFEYLMPLLVMPTYENSLLDRTYRTVVNMQIRYGALHGVPWGISESGYNKTDTLFNYQYSAFGVPGLGFKPGLAEDLVIAPYASAMALMVCPEKACLNLQKLAQEGYEGRYGFYEAIDFTPSHLPPGASKTAVFSFMSHHQGMTLLALAYLLLDKPMQRRFENHTAMKPGALLLQERVPRIVPFYPHLASLPGSRGATRAKELLFRVFSTPHTPKPEVHLLSNGAYHVMITNAGGGYSRWRELALTRWREDATRDHWGTFCFIRDLTGKETWSNTYQPTLKEPKNYDAIFSQARAEFRRTDGRFKTHTEITVSPEDDIELRRIRVTNHSPAVKTLEFTSYAETVLLNPAADELHPAFNNLFMQTEIIRPRQAVLCTRRPSSGNEKPPFMFHLMNLYGAGADKVSYETDRSKFIGRGRTIHNPRVIDGNVDMSDSEGFVLDPVAAIRCVLAVEPEQTVMVDLVTGVSETREGAVSLIEKYKDRHLADRVFALSWAHGQVVLHQLNATEADAQIFGRLASSILYANPLFRANASILLKNTRGQPGLWGHGVSGDLPVVLLKISNGANLDLVRQLVGAHAYWRRKGLSVDLVILNEDYSVYRQQLHDQIMGFIASSIEAHAVDKPGGIVIRRSEHLSDEDKILLETVARIVITDNGGPLADQIERKGRQDAPFPLLKPARKFEVGYAFPAGPVKRDLAFFNGTGGFTQDGREYVILTRPGAETPLPWINVLANRDFGTTVSESGSGYTWSENAHEYRLTPWHNDAVCDSGGEAFYMRDEETGRVWSPAPWPVRGPLPYVSRHGFGYSVFEYSDDGIATELSEFVSTKDPVKFSVIRISNRSDRPRKLSATRYCELVLGDFRRRNSMHVITEIDPRSGALFARNPYNTEFAGRVVFMEADNGKKSWTGDRAEFLGRNGTPASPFAMKRTKLSGKTGPGLDPCVAMRVQVELAAGGEQEIVFIFGSAKNAGEARDLVLKHRATGSARSELEGVWEYWKQRLGTLYIETPDKTTDMMANGWLIYQTLASRMFARSGFYQSGGAYGFRDQLQDSMALMMAAPELAREHLLRCAARQFREGDVQHWWHPPINRGVRTRCSDDYLWLPLAVSRYVSMTGDTGVLDEKVNFIEGRPLNDGEESYYDKPVRSEESASLYAHCVRAVEYGLKFGAHGLPLMGSGDWNDGMNLVGAQGRGESVWLGFFMVHVLSRFSATARLRADPGTERLCLTAMESLKQSINDHGWDGAWYLRAFFDSGEALGSASNDECRIDSISQSWSVLSGAGDPEKAKAAMEAVAEKLVDRKNSLVLLLAPPFNRAALEPGYIKGYAPGIRENGGQYTHAAVWAVMAFAELGRKELAWQLFSMINPVRHGMTARDIEVYKVEPYVAAADVYANPQHAGRGGWTWYTGSAAWMYRLIVESFLGLTLETDRLKVNAPCLPPDWKSFKVHYRYRETFHHINFSVSGEGNKVLKLTLDGTPCEGGAIPLADDRREHYAEVEIG